MYLNDKLPQIETETKVDPYTLPALIAWLRTKDADERYSFWNTNICPLAQYGRSVGLSGSNTPFIVQDRIGERLGLSWLNKYRLIGLIVSRHPRTFGAALARAEALARELP